MKIDVTAPPRAFMVGRRASVELKDCGRIALGSEELVTFVTPAGGEFDVTAKSWGFHATPSTNARLARFGLRTVLVLNSKGHLFVLLVERGQEAGFQAYIDDEQLRVLAWLDDDAAVSALERCLTRY